MIALEPSFDIQTASFSLELVRKAVIKFVSPSLSRPAALKLRTMAMAASSACICGGTSSTAKHTASRAMSTDEATTQEQLVLHVYHHNPSYLPFCKVYK